jgi:hypothetical protein
MNVFDTLRAAAQVLRQISVHAEVAGVHTNPPAARQDPINKTQSVTVRAVGAHISRPPH